ncbi:MAG: 2-oxoacid:ferredoxin oxidoreductase subunit beta [Propionibacteriaceae bacterium]|jgi:2-oxoglutarate ferredoxin oxidoreductase subunit beta|nr:2-oxoacid:ferredoxin oxidoreductase subunit beta [Propionibacteriaceae bacterium]
MRGGLDLVPTSPQALRRADFTSSAEVRWCPGCGDYSILAALTGLLPELGVKRENIVIVSGIGCSSRLPYYVDTYGLHSIHGRAPAIASGIAIARPDLSVWVVSGDGDALSIGGNHLIHALRRNVNLNILLFNNRIYGLTKGQYSPTSELGKVTGSSPVGSTDHPFNPVSLALGAEASFVARALDTDRPGLTDALRQAAQHRGAALVEIYQNCPIFNDGAYDSLKGPTSDQSLIRLEQGRPIVFDDGRWGLIRDPASGDLQVAAVDQVGLDRVLIHDATRPDPSLAFALSRLTDLSGQIKRCPIGVFRDVERPCYDDLVRQQVTWPAQPEVRGGALSRWLAGPEPWTVD